MHLSEKEFWVVLHGLILGSLFLLAFSGGIAGLWSLRPGFLTQEGLDERMKRLKWGSWILAAVCWATVITGTFLVYIWYREKVPTSPRSMLLANPDKAAWHTFGMEWKEHVAWISPFLATAVAWMIQKYDRELLKRQDLRQMAFVLFLIAFATAAVAGLFGAFINKAAPLL